MVNAFYLLLPSAVVGTLPPQYTYANGNSLNLVPGKSSFHGISDLITLGSSASPFDESTIHLTEASSGRAIFNYAKVERTDEYDDAFAIGAAIHGSYGGFSGSVSAKYMESKKLTSKSSFYFFFFERQLGTQYLNSDAALTKSALADLTSNPEIFVQKYGQYFIDGYTTGCQASVTVTLTAKSEYEKKGLDLAASASYMKMINASVSFKSDVEKQSGFSSMQTDVQVNGGSVPAAVTNIEDVKRLVIDPLDDMSACTANSAIISRVMIKSWLAHPAVASVADSKIINSLMPAYVIPTQVLNRFSLVRMRAATYLGIADTCHSNVFRCSTKQWDEPVAERENLYRLAYDQLMQIQDNLTSATETTLAKGSSVVLGYENLVENAYQSWLKPAMTLVPLSFTFKVSVSTYYDNWEYPPPVGTRDATATLSVDPNRQDTTSQAVNLTNTIRLDNGHSVCNHFHGNLSVQYQNDQLCVRQWWSRVCGSESFTPWQCVKPGNTPSGSYTYDEAVKTYWSFTVAYNNSYNSQCGAVKYAYCCNYGTPCDCSKGWTASGQCSSVAYAYCCAFETACDCSAAEGFDAEVAQLV